jgi:hypothetical protein
MNIQERKTIFKNCYLCSSLEILVLQEVYLIYLSLQELTSSLGTLNLDE